ncbi:hypothetical protein JB92DRAFT_2837177 [Gautieria morchelliformis]|nr:hypothetical protein JB92DRAFT_2837177 [Gautieria morchelliformis]
MDKNRRPAQLILHKFNHWFSFAHPTRAATMHAGKRRSGGTHALLEDGVGSKGKEKSLTAPSSQSAANALHPPRSAASAPSSAWSDQARVLWQTQCGDDEEMASMWTSLRQRPCDRQLWDLVMRLSLWMTHRPTSYQKALQ